MPGGSESDPGAGSSVGTPEDLLLQGNAPELFVFDEKVGILRLRGRSFRRAHSAQNERGAGGCRTAFFDCRWLETS